MLFNSYTFVIFFAVVLALHHVRLFSWQTKKINLLIASYLFYAAWNPPFVILLWFSTILDWIVVKRMIRLPLQSRWRLALLVTSLTSNLGLLAVFKYGGFLVDNFAVAMSTIGISWQAAAFDIILPVGISFYTFQTLSYTIDTYRGKLHGWHSFTDYALYVTFFPQLVAGPIVRAATFLPQCIDEPRITRQQIGWGVSLMVLGLFNKMVIADALMAPVVDAIYDTHAPVSFAGAWIGTLAFSAQIFCDFAGYSTCAIGAAMCLGFALPDNFRFPYAAIGFSDFWKRWHISLSSWLRDYLYISLGGNRHGYWRTLINLNITMLLGGLWHGASWTFVVWGALHGLYLTVEHLAKKILPAWAIFQTFLVRYALALFTFFLVCVTWVFFRAATFDRAFHILRAMLGFETHEADGLIVSSSHAIMVLGITVAMLALHWALRDCLLESVVRRMPWWLRAAILAGMVLGILLIRGDDRAFIYFQF